MDSCPTTFTTERIYFQDQRLYPTSFTPSKSLSRRTWRRTLFPWMHRVLGGDAVIWGIVYMLVKDNAVFPIVFLALQHRGRLILSAVHQVVPYAFRKGWWMRGKGECREYLVGGVEGISISEQGKWYFCDFCFLHHGFIWILSSSYTPRQWLIKSLILSC